MLVFFRGRLQMFFFCWENEVVYLTDDALEISHVIQIYTQFEPLPIQILLEYYMKIKPFFCKL